MNERYLYDLFDSGFYNVKVVDLPYMLSSEEIKEKMKYLSKKYNLRFHIFFTSMGDPDYSIIRDSFYNPLEDNINEFYEDLVEFNDMFSKEIVIQDSLNSTNNSLYNTLSNHNYHNKFHNYTSVFPLKVLNNSQFMTLEELRKYDGQPFFSIDISERAEIYLIPTEKPETDEEMKLIENNSFLFSELNNEYGGYVYLISIKKNIPIVYALKNKPEPPYTNIKDILEKQPFLKVKKIKKYDFK